MIYWQFNFFLHLSYNFLYYYFNNFLHNLIVNLLFIIFFIKNIIVVKMKMMTHNTIHCKTYDGDLVRQEVKIMIEKWFRQRKSNNARIVIPFNQLLETIFRHLWIPKAPFAFSLYHFSFYNSSFLCFKQEPTSTKFLFHGLENLHSIFILCENILSHELNLC